MRAGCELTFVVTKLPFTELISQSFVIPCNRSHRRDNFPRYSLQATTTLRYLMEIQMSKILATLVASLFALSAFAADAPKADAKAAEVKPAVTAPAAPKADGKEHKKHKAGKKHAKKAAEAAAPAPAAK
jgi:hypothetical protein